MVEFASGSPAVRSRGLPSPRLTAAVLTLACLAGLGLTCFGDILFRDHQFAYRDAGHYYYPLYLRVQQEWEAGRWPLWAPELNGGTPLLGNLTAAVLYPGKAVFFLLPYPWAVRAYGIAHVYLAFGALWLLLRSWRVSVVGSSLGALAYAFGAPVLSQTCNVIFLVGAAWTPLGFLAADRWLRLGRRRALPALALVLAMQVLGGEPEAAYLTVVCASAYAAGLAAARTPSSVGWLLRRVSAGLVPVSLVLLALSWWSARARLTAAAVDGPAPWFPPVGPLVLTAWIAASALVVRRVRSGQDARGFGPMMGGIVVASALALALAGAGFIPALEMNRRSFRAVEAEALHDIYPFSVNPLLLAGSIWPDVYGTTDRGNRSWSVAIPPRHEDNLWMPSLYLGGLTLVFALSATGFRDGPPWRAWLTGVAFVSLLAALGAYGSPLLWARLVPGWSSWLGPIDLRGVTKVRVDGLLQDGDGGVYWLLAWALPGFRSFRYPAKLLVFTALAISGLAGMGWDRLVEDSSRRARVIACGLFAASLAALAAAWAGAGPIRVALDGLNEMRGTGFGPLDVSGAIGDLRAAIVRGALAYGVAAVLAVAARRRPGLAGGVALVALGLDLGLANSRQVIAVPQSAFEEIPHLARLIQAEEEARPSPGPFRVQRVGLWWPGAWYAQGSPRRVEEIARWSHGTLRPNYGMPLGISMTLALDTTAMVDYASFLFPRKILLDEETARGPGLAAGAEVYYHPRRGFDLWNTGYFIVPSYLVLDSLERGFGAFVPRTTQVYPPPGSFSGPDGPARRKAWEKSYDVRLLRNEAAFPRAWVVHRARLVPPFERSEPAQQRKFMNDLLYQDDALWHLPGKAVHDPRVTAWVETDEPAAFDGLLSRALPDPAETVTVTRDTPQRVDLTAVLHTPGMVVVADVYYPGWTLTVDGRPARILRTNRAMRGVALEAGTHRLVFRYQPWSFSIGLALSGLGLVGLAGIWAWARRDPAQGRSAVT